VYFVLAGALLLAWGDARSQIAPYPTPPAEMTSGGQERPEAAALAGSSPPTAVIRGWSMGSEVAPESESLEPLVLSAGNRDVVVFFDAAQNRKADLEFRYRLTGYDPDWTVTRSKLAHYRRLSPGHFDMEVEVREAGGQWPAIAATLKIVQRRFFYQTWYFYVLVGVGMVLLGTQLLSQRDQLVKGEMGIVLEERNRIASDCHDTLMAGFAAISWQLEATAKLFRDTQADLTPAAKSCELARSMVAHCQAEARRIIWDLRDTEELTDNLSQALTRALSAHRTRETIETTFEVYGEETPIAPGAVHHLVCIGQEAITNAVRHAQATNIHVVLRYETDSLNLSIKDDGKGFYVSDTSTRTGHFGIPVMQERARKLGGALRLTSSAQSGTEVAVTVSFQAIDWSSKQRDVVPWIGV
jgi:signal transduction histidine kinase